MQIAYGYRKLEIIRSKYIDIEKLKTETNIKIQLNF